MSNDPIHFGVHGGALVVYRGPRPIARWDNPAQMPRLLMTLALGGWEISEGGVIHEMTEGQRKNLAVMAAQFWAGSE
jgi:hypothetical protein